VTEEQFINVYFESITDVADSRYPKNETAAHGGAATPGRGEFLRDAAILCVDLTVALTTAGYITREGENT